MNKEYLKNLLRNNNKKLKDSSINVYTNKLLNLRTLMKIGEDDGWDFIKDFKKVGETLSHLSDNTTRSIYVALGKFMEIFPDLFEKEIEYYSKTENNLRRVIDERRKDNKKSQREIDNWIDWEDLQILPELIKEEIENENGVKHFNIYQDYIISLLYIKCDYLLRRDWYKFSFTYNKSELNENWNQILIQPDYIEVYLNDFKNVRTFGKVKFRFKELLEKEIRKWIEFKKTRINNNHLLTSLNLRQLFLKYIEKDINLNILRKIRSTSIEEEISKHPEWSYKQKEHLHHFLIHPLSEGMLYSKNN